jgi:hypothetical protein
LREPKPLRGFGFAEFALRANSWAAWGGVWGKAPNSENQNALRFGSPCAGQLASPFGLGSFASQNSRKLFSACSFDFADPLGAYSNSESKNLGEFLPVEADKTLTL